MNRDRSDLLLQINNKSSQVLLDAMLSTVIQKYPYIKGTLVNPNDFIFEERVKMNCFYCGRYNSNWKCPPKIPDIDYKKMFAEFDNAAFIYLRLPLTEGMYNEVRSESSVILHRVLLEFEKYLWNYNNSTAISFIGGSCKLCKNGCGKDKCNNPYVARSPLEATGVNIVKTAMKYKIDIKFPPKDSMLRLGVILW